ncbi:glycosyltransferase [Corynebacterium coyleae]|uniref:glycosyltransferase n=1 Tax=Corynebacterium coyleae TaxID=53374 RepID=UPI001CD01394|nr:glycosyltransferase [Corynebacterium coyleae]UBI09838.1 glycosyltransferase [Corynebacterium coyleae]
MKAADENRGSMTNLVLISHLYDGKRGKISYLNDADQIVRQDLLDANEKPARAMFFDNEGRCVLYNVQLNSQIQYWVLFGENWEEITFKSESDLALYWLKNCNADILTDNVCITEWATDVPFFRQVNEAMNTKFAIQFHSNHLAGNRRYGITQTKLKATINAANDLGEIVVLTDDQRADILKEFSGLSQVTAIPHYVEVPDDFAGNRNPKTVVALARFVDGKRIQNIIIAFEKVVREVPDAKLEIWGYGTMEPIYEREISKAGLQNNVTICGYTDNPFQVYRKAAVSVFASTFEGFNMSLVESVLCGCVPVSLDFKYGPRHSIVNGVTGFVTDPENFDELSDAIIFLLKRPDVARKMAAAGVQRMQRINSPATILAKWMDLFDRLGAR